MESKTLIAAVIGGVMAIALVYQSVRINGLEYRLFALENPIGERPVIAEAPDPEPEFRPRRERLPQPQPRLSEAEVQQRLELANQRSQTERRERWKTMWHQQMVEEVNTFAAANNIPPRVADEIAVVVDVHSEDSRLRWEKVHDGTLGVSEAREQADAARQALRDEMEDQIGQEKWADLEGRIDLRSNQRAGAVDGARPGRR